MSDKIQRLINDLTADIIDIYDIHIPIRRDINDVVTALGGYIEESTDICSSGGIKKQNDGFVIYVPS